MLQFVGENYPSYEIWSNSTVLKFTLMVLISELIEEPNNVWRIQASEDVNSTLALSKRISIFLLVVSSSIKRVELKQCSLMELINITIKIYGSVSVIRGVCKLIQGTKIIKTYGGLFVFRIVQKLL